MKAAVLKRPGLCVVEDVPTPQVGDGELLVKVEANTICGTDVRLIDGTKTAGVRPGVILGHEFCGRIAQVGGGVDGFSEGQQVSVSPAVVCHECPQCRAGMENLCVNLRLFGYEFDGGLAEYVRIPADAVMRGRIVTPSKPIPPQLLALAEPLSCVLNGQRQTPICSGMSVVVMGTGPIGLMHVALAAWAGAQVIAVGRAGRLDQARAMGGAFVTDVQGAQLRSFVWEHTNQCGADVVIVCASSVDLARDAVALLRPGGTVNFFAGFPAGQDALLDVNAIHYRQLRVVGSANARLEDHNAAVDLLSGGSLDLSSLVTHCIALSNFEEALATVRFRRGLKVAVVPE